MRVGTPMDLIIKRHPEKKKQIRKYMEKWNKRTAGGQKWPKEGTFDPTCCDEMEAVINEPTDKSDKREGKRIRETRPADRRPEQREKRVRRPSEGGSVRSQLLYSDNEAHVSMEGCPSGSDSGEEEEDSILASGTRRVVHGELWIEDGPAVRIRDRKQ
ncbi:hypothetical protein SKAU_G00413310 [Synaphobranchus kaupii]|uniref:Uncharacterized protein n=1 Tax=Synaphobranchus kaupii TaxID=118154 RepID=A0A9Q1E8C3_SYNKA|nr:hypothetical protein SKAU_G00413310 [Synaphobranchus kaupii]